LNSVGMWSEFGNLVGSWWEIQRKIGFSHSMNMTSDLWVSLYVNENPHGYKSFSMSVGSSVERTSKVHQRGRISPGIPPVLKINIMSAVWNFWWI
jgi:hypothetical protein